MRFADYHARTRQSQQLSAQTLENTLATSSLCNQPSEGGAEPTTLTPASHADQRKRTGFPPEALDIVGDIALDIAGAAAVAASPSVDSPPGDCSRPDVTAALAAANAASALSAPSEHCAEDHAPD